MKNLPFLLLLALAAAPVLAAQKPAVMREHLVLQQERALHPAVPDAQASPAADDGAAPALKPALRLLPPEERPVEIHDRLAPTAAPEKGPRVALTLDACMGRFDQNLIDFLIRNRVPATIFATRRWLVHNPQGVALIKSHLDLFDVEDHGANHVPAVIGAGKRVYGIPGEPDVAHLKSEVDGGARAIKAALGVTPRWYRDATAEYDTQSLAEIARMGYKIAGFSVNADEGATLPKAVIEARVKRAKDGDVIIAHMNRPQSDTAQGLSAGIQYLLARGFVFVRVDQAGLRRIPAPRPRRKRHT
ncbi:MAG TPA: polysaccharide deacetylase family protein [Gallionellaceae bacterium]|nr:polysaccharide deacetylase family protein [Gallionellaceae bacterium]